MTAARAMFDVAIGSPNAVVRVVELETLVGRAAETAPDANSLIEKWHAIRHAIDNAKNLLIHVPIEQMAQRIATNPTFTQLWAGHAFLLSNALTALEDEVRRLRGKWLEKDKAMTLREMAKILNCSESFLHKQCSHEDKSHRPPHFRVGRSIRFFRDEVLTFYRANRSLLEKNAAPPVPESSAGEPRKDKRKRRQPKVDGNVSGTGIRRP